EKHSQKSPLLKTWLIIGFVAGFTTILFFIISYVKKVLLCDAACAVQNNVIVALILSALVGVVAGSFTYYFIAERYEKKITRLHDETGATLRFLDSGERTVIKTVIEHHGRITQKKLASETGFSRVKVSRLISSLEAKAIVSKSEQGMTNIISLHDDIAHIFLHSE
ncbi:MAG: helix-turn-helix transcriptional regulator, partial [Nanoarchaeota archaeon]